MFTCYYIASNNQITDNQKFFNHFSRIATAMFLSATAAIKFLASKLISTLLSEAGQSVVIIYQIGAAVISEMISADNTLSDSTQLVPTYSKLFVFEALE